MILAEEDIDDVEGVVTGLGTKVDSEIKEIKDDVGGVKKVLIGVLIGVIVSTVMLAIDILVRASAINQAIE